MSTFTIFKKTVGKYKWRIVLLGVIGLFSSVLGGLGVGAIVPLLSLIVGDQTPPTDRITKFIIGLLHYLPFQYNVYSLSIAVAVAFISKAIFSMVFRYLRVKVIYDYKVETLSGLFADILNARWQFLLGQKIGHMQNVFLRDVDKSAELLNAISSVMSAVMNVVVFLILAIAISPSVTLIAGVGGFVVLFFFRPLLRRLKDAISNVTLQNKAISQFIIEYLTGIKSIKISAVPEQVLRAGEKAFTTWRWYEFKSAVLSSINKTALEPVSVLFIAVTFLVSYSRPGFNLAAFMATVVLIQRVFVYLQSTQASVQGFVETIPYTAHVIAFREQLQGVAEGGTARLPFHFNHEITFSNTHFAYHENTPVLSGLNFSVRRGETVGLMGTSGAGKTSVADLLIRLFDPTRGNILVDGVDSRQFDIRDWRDHFGYVSQDIFLLNDTIAANIQFFNDAVTEEDMIAAAKKANIYEFIVQLKKGFETVVGDRGMMLSGGQRQRIILARVLARKPPVLILDEATSALDNESEALIQKSISGLKGATTVFIIAHRLSTLMDVDRLFVLDKGKIIEEGNPHELLKDEASYFYRVYHAKDKELS